MSLGIFSRSESPSFDSCDYQSISSQFTLDEASEALESPLVDHNQRKTLNRKAAVDFFIGKFMNSSNFASSAEEFILERQLPLLVQALNKSAIELEGGFSDLDALHCLNSVCDLLYLVLSTGPKHLIKDELEACGIELEESLLKVLKLSLEMPKLPIKKIVMLLVVYIDLHLTNEVPEESGPITKRMLRTVRLQLPMRDLPAPNEVEAFYVNFMQRRMILHEKPVLHSIVSGLLRVLLACCPNPNSVSPIIDIDQELNDLSSSDRTRHRFIMAYSISRFFILLIKRLESNHVIQSSYLAQLITETNGVLVLLKFLNQDFNLIHLNQQREFSEGQLKTIDLKAVATEHLLKLAYRLTRGFKERIEVNLVQVKGHLILKRLLPFFPENGRVTDAALKLLRVQVRYLPKKWINYTSNMKLISLIYLRLKPCHEDWLTGSFPSQKDIMTHAELKQLTTDFNQHHYYWIETEPTESWTDLMELEEEEDHLIDY